MMAVNLALSLWLLIINSSLNRVDMIYCRIPKGQRYQINGVESGMHIFSKNEGEVEEEEESTEEGEEEVGNEVDMEAAYIFLRSYK